jgi:uncharacterized protein (TIGR03083 family)
MAVDLEALKRSVDTIGAAPAGSYDHPVVSCPGWDVADVVSHVGRVHRWVIAALGAPVDERVRYPADPALAGADLRAWYREGAAALVADLAAADLDLERWTFSGPQPTRWWLRRQVHENAVHAWDVQSALGRPEPLPTDIAVDGIDEYLEVFLPRLDTAAFGGAGESRLLRGTEAPPAWRRTFDPATVVVDRFDVSDAASSSADAGTVAAGAASDLGLFVWSRVAPDLLVTTGDAALLTRFQAASSI